MFNFLSKRFCLKKSELETVAVDLLRGAALETP